MVNCGDGSLGRPKRWLILAVLAAVAFMAQLDLFIVNVALPVIGRSYPGSDLSGLSWVLNAYAIVFAALLVLAGVAVFTLASAACAVAPSLGLLVAARAVQAAGAALIVPTSLGLLYPAFARRRHAMVVGIWAGVGAVAATAGPPVGGLLVGLSWRWIFLINVPIGIVTLLAGLLAAVTLFVLGTVQGPDWGWTSARTLALLAVAATALTVARTLRHPHALIERDLFTSRAFTGASVALFVYYVGFAIFLLSGDLRGPHPGPVRPGAAGPGGDALHGRRGGLLAGPHGRPAGLGGGVPARDDRRRHLRRADPGPAVRGGRHPAAGPGHHRQRRAQHGPPGRQRGRRGPGGRRRPLPPPLRRPAQFLTGSTRLSSPRPAARVRRAWPGTGRLAQRRAARAGQAH
jgi:MFS family permease